MFRVAAPSTSAAGVVEYFDKHLGKGDYYLDGSEHDQGLPGVWRGEGATMLGLENGSLVDRESFRRLANNLHPETGEQLTARNSRDRRVGWDMSFNAPKSVSLLYQQTKNPQILEAFINSARDTMQQDVEPEIEARVRKGRPNLLENRTSGNAVWGEFVHFTARPVDGIPDPNLHVHNYIFNSTLDEFEGQWKAVDLGGLDRPFIQARFHSRLAGQMRELGYGIEKTGPGWQWDVAGVPRELIDKFSRRSEVVNKKAEELGITSDKGKDQLAARTREAKRDDLSMEDLEEI